MDGSKLPPESQAAWDAMRDFEEITPDVGLASVQKTWQFVQQLTDPDEHTNIARRLRDFFDTEIERTKS